MVLAGMGIITSINWGLNFLVAQTWPPMDMAWKKMHGFGGGGFFWYAIWCAIGFCLILL
jgi:hypothetical protein